jgi:hypothetical protein
MLLNSRRFARGLQLLYITSLAVVLESATNTQIRTNRLRGRLTLPFKEFASVSSRANYPIPLVIIRNLPEEIMNLSQNQVAAFIGIDWADQKHDVVLRWVGRSGQGRTACLRIAG